MKIKLVGEGGKTEGRIKDSTQISYLNNQMDGGPFTEIESNKQRTYLRVREFIVGVRAVCWIYR